MWPIGNAFTCQLSLKSSISHVGMSKGQRVRVKCLNLVIHTTEDWPGGTSFMEMQVGVVLRWAGKSRKLQPEGKREGTAENGVLLGQLGHHHGLGQPELRPTFDENWEQMKMLSEVSQKGTNNFIHCCIYMKSRRMVLMSLFAGRQWRCRHRTDVWTRGGGGGGEGGANWENSLETYTLPYVK